MLKCYQQGSFEEAEASFRSQIKVLEEDILRQKVKACLILFQLVDLTFIITAVVERVREEIPPRTRAHAQRSACDRHEDCSSASAKSTTNREDQFSWSRTK